jgi:hypothetical protein
MSYDKALPKPESSIPSEEMTANKRYVNGRSEEKAHKMSQAPSNSQRRLYATLY